MHFLLPAKQNQAENWVEFEDFEASASELRWLLLLGVPFFFLDIGKIVWWRNWSVQKGFWLGLWIWRTSKRSWRLCLLSQGEDGWCWLSEAIFKGPAIVKPCVSHNKHIPPHTHVHTSAPPPPMFGKNTKLLGLVLSSWVIMWPEWLSITLVQCSILIRSQIGGLATSPMGSFLCLIFLSLASCNAQRKIMVFSG